MIEIHLSTLGLVYEIPELAIPVYHFFKSDKDQAEFVPPTIYMCPPCGFIDYKLNFTCPICDNQAWVEYTISLDDD